MHRHHVPCAVDCANRVPCTVHRYRVPLPRTVYRYHARPHHVPCTVTQTTGGQGNRRLGVPAELSSRGIVAADPGTDPGKGERHTRGNPCGVPVRCGAGQRRNLTGSVGETVAVHISKVSIDVLIVYSPNTSPRFVVLPQLVWYHAGRHHTFLSEKVRNV